MKPHTVDHWGRFAGDFDRRQVAIAGEEMQGKLRQGLEAQRDLGDLLELGCGNCGFTSSVRGNTSSIVATDNSDAMLEAARRTMAGANDVTVKKADCLDLPYREKSFDSILMANLIHVIPRPERALDEALRVLRPGGRLLLVSFTADGLDDKALKGLIARYLAEFGPPPSERTNFTRQSLTALVKERGFSIDSSELIRTDESSAIFIVASRPTE